MKLSTPEAWRWGGCGGRAWNGEGACAGPGQRQWLGPSGSRCNEEPRGTFLRDLDAGVEGVLQGFSLSPLEDGVTRS